MIREKLKRFVHSNPFTESLLGIERKIQYYYIPVKRFKRGQRLRSKGSDKCEAINRIKGIHNQYLGERCFIICTGPSLTKEDLIAIKNEYTFGMNSLALMEDWLPTFYGIQDMNVYEKMPVKVKGMSSKRPVFITKSIYKAGHDVFSKNNNVYLMPVYCSDHLINPESDRFEFSTDCFLKVYDGFSITISLIQIAYYMGFREIYLIGADCNYTQNGQNHFIEYGLKDPYAHKATNRNIRTYEKVKEFADNNDLKVFNATRGGMLEVFPRVNIDEMDLK